MDLVSKEQAEGRDGKRVGPQLFAEQSPDQTDLDYPVPEQEECGKDLGIGGEILYGVEEKRGNKVVGILAELVLHEPPQQCIDLLGMHQEQDDTAHDLKSAVHGLAKQTDGKEEVNRLVSTAVFGPYLMPPKTLKTLYL